MRNSKSQALYHCYNRLKTNVITSFRKQNSTLKKVKATGMMRKSRVVKVVKATNQVKKTLLIMIITRIKLLTNKYNLKLKS